MPIYDPQALAGDKELSKTYIGATKAPVLYMQDPPHPYSTMYELWMEKTGRIEPEDISEKDVIEVGNAMEQTIADLWYKKHKDEGWTKPERMEGLYRDEEYPFLACHIDFVTTNEHTGETILIECKNSGMSTKDWTPEPPDHYYLQCQYEMLVTQINRCVLAAWVGNRLFIEHSIDASPELMSGLKSVVIEFWRNHIETDVHPPLSFKDSDLIKNHMPEIGSEIIEIRDDLLPQLQEYLTVRNSYEKMTTVYKETEQLLKLCEAKIAVNFADSKAKIIKIGEAEYRRSWRNNPPTWNENVMKQKYPDAYAECRRQSKSPRREIKINKITII